MAIKVQGREVLTTLPETHRIRRKGKHVFFVRTMLRKGESVENFEEFELQ